MRSNPRTWAYFLYFFPTKYRSSAPDVVCSLPCARFLTKTDLIHGTQKSFPIMRFSGLLGIYQLPIALREYVPYTPLMSDATLLAGSVSS